jgi:hypothetical protein
MEIGEGTMRWKAEDMERLIGMEEYVDTLLYPVCVFDGEWENAWIKEQFWLERVCGYAERQLTGRLFLFQPLTTAYKPEDGHSTTSQFIEQNIRTLRGRFACHLVVTNHSGLAQILQGRNIVTYVLSAPPEEKNDSKSFLEKALRESQSIVKHCISLWQNS